MSEEFVAALDYETPVGTDTLRLVVPSEQVARELLKTLLAESVDRFTKNDARGKPFVEYPERESHATITIRKLAP